MNIIRWGVIGCGSVTEYKSTPAYMLVEGFCVEGVMCRNPLKAKHYAKEKGIVHFFEDAEEMIRDSRIDAIYIATPPDTHAYYAKKVAKAKKPCCIEKPITSDFTSAKEVVSLFKALKVPLFVAYYRRSLPRFLMVKRWLDEGKIGEVRQVRWSLTRMLSQKDREGVYNWRVDANVAYGGYFDDVASHGLDLLIFLLGEIQEVNGISLNQQSVYSAKDAVVGYWVHKSGVLGVGSWNFGSDRREDLVEIYGSEGKISFSVLDEAAIVYEREGEKISEEIVNPSPIQIYHVQNMAKALFEGFSHPSVGESALHTAWVMDKLLGRL